MTAQDVITDAFLAISCISLIVQWWALAHLVTGRSGLVRTGLLRTAVCRSGCAVLYVYVGLNALVFGWYVIDTTFSAFVVIQVTWWANAFADVRLKQQLANPGRS